jgi:hypothetical protein
MVMYSAIYYGVFYFQRELIFFKKTLLRFHILLMHVIEYHFNVIWNLVYSISNNAIYDQQFCDILNKVLKGNCNTFISLW